MATAKPVTASDSANLSFMASTAPFTTDESKPKRNPPTAPASASQITRRGIWAVVCSCAVGMVLPGFGGSDGCGADVVGCGTGPDGRRTRAKQCGTSPAAVPLGVPQA